MTHSILVVAPLVLVVSVMVFAFVGCGLQTSGLGAPEQYKTDITTHPKLVSYWRLGEAPGATTAADSKDGNAGTYTGGVTLGQPGLVVNDSDTAAQFDGSTGFVKVPHNDDSLNPPKFTIEALVSVAGGDGQFRAVVSARDVVQPAGSTHGFIVYASDQDNWEAWLGDGTASWQVVTGPKATPGGHFLAITYDGTTLKLYVDPAEDNSASKAAAYQPNTNQELRIGAGANEGTPLYFFNGLIDDVAVYNDALDFATIRSHFVLAWTGSTAGL
jgi:hypothetical protein